MSNKHDIGCLVIHGFGGSVDEVSPLALRLREKGYKVVCPRLEGHIGRRRDLRRAGYRDWVSSVSFPLPALINFNLFLRRTKPLLSHVTCPVFVAQGVTTIP